MMVVPVTVSIDVSAVLSTVHAIRRGIWEPLVTRGWITRP